MTIDGRALHAAYAADCRRLLKTAGFSTRSKPSRSGARRSRGDRPRPHAGPSATAQRRTWSAPRLTTYQTALVADCAPDFALPAWGQCHRLCVGAAPLFFSNRSE